MHGTEELGTKGLPTVASYFCENTSTVGQEGKRTDKNESQSSHDWWSRRKGVR